MIENENNKELTEASLEEVATDTAAAKAKAEGEVKKVKREDVKAQSGAPNLRQRSRRPKVSATGFEEKVVKIKRISKTTKGGRRMRFSALVVIGDKAGKVGFGIGKSTEVPSAIKKAIKNARNAISNVIMNKRGTIYHETVGRHGASKVLLKPAPEGTGIIAGGAIRAVIELAGYKDIYTKNMGSNTSLNMVIATVNGLVQQRHPLTIAKLRDKDIKEI
jgi:small subunit ribosomal protein S5